MDELGVIKQRIKQKIEDYQHYGFDSLQVHALKAFFDLAQEYQTIENLYRICVSVPKVAFDLESNLYLISSKTDELELVCSSKLGIPLHPLEEKEREITLSSTPYSMDDSYITPIKGNRLLIAQLPFEAKDDIIGMFETYPVLHLDEREKFFFEKYANRIGFSLHNKMLVQRNVEHLKFINSLVADIEHNVIIPNMFYKLFFRRLHGKIQKNREIEGTLEAVIASYESANDSGVEELKRLHRELASVNEGLSEEYANIQKHYQNTSLFLETLLRPDHFEKGRYIVRKRKCNFKKQIIDPQLERYEARFKARNINVDERVGGVPDEEMNLAVDIGLISQVYANLFSNALKYAEDVLDGNGYRMKYVSHGREVLKDYFAPGIDGIKFNVFTTGPHLSEKEMSRLYEEGFRGSNADKEPGTGHGLHFIRNVVEIHGGNVGYEPTPLGNNFYFILPK